MVRIIFVILLFTVGLPGHGQVFAPSFNPFSSCQPPSTFANQKVREILQTINASGIQVPNFILCKNYYVPNAYAQAYRIQQFDVVQIGYRIDYNPRWFGQSDVAVGNDWALVGVLSHEIGHLQHFLQLNRPSASNPVRDMYQAYIPQLAELRADKFAGFTLAKMGASLDDIISVQRTLFTLHGSLTHPNSLTRLQKLFEGYVDGGGANPAQVQAMMAEQQNLANRYTRWE